MDVTLFRLSLRQIQMIYLYLISFCFKIIHWYVLPSDIYFDSDKLKFVVKNFKGFQNLCNELHIYLFMLPHESSSQSLAHIFPLSNHCFARKKWKQYSMFLKNLLDKNTVAYLLNFLTDGQKKISISINARSCVLIHCLCVIVHV